VLEKALATATAAGGAVRGSNVARACAPARVLYRSGFAGVPSALVTVALMLARVILVIHY
jgi:hypothetical protein